MEEERTKRKPLVLDWNKLLPNRDEEPTPILVVEPTSTEFPKPSSADLDRQQAMMDFYRTFSDKDLEDKILCRKKNFDESAMKLPDRGAKLLAGLKLLEEEKERRKLRRVQEETDGRKEHPQSTSSIDVGTSNCFNLENASYPASTKSSFTSLFYQKLGENNDCRTGKAFDNELSMLSRFDNRKIKYNGKLAPKQRHKGHSSERKKSFKGPCNLSLKDSDAPVFPTGEKLISYLSKNKLKDPFCERHSSDLRHAKAHPVVLVDEEDSRRMETPELVDEQEQHRMETPELVDEQEQHHMGTAELVDERMKEANIYYPSRDDPESIEIRFDDIKCLDPEGYLTSTIMNFYIRYLQQQASSTLKMLRDYYFFNTYFYKKLKEAVSYKGKDKDTFFVKFRRWWKGINIFQKAYVFIPIHEDLHWSLVIICMPDKEDESGPMILHLDSLGYHSSRSVFDNVKSYMKEEWYYLDKTVAASDLPLADRIWKHLPRRIDEKIITVPQQKNDCDCGLFVLFFIKRFIEEAPERLKRKDLTMFNRQWFKPEEASSLRSKIKNLLRQEFEKSIASTAGSSRGSQQE